MLTFSGFKDKLGLKAKVCCLCHTKLSGETPISDGIGATCLKKWSTLGQIKGFNYDLLGPIIDSAFKAKPDLATELQRTAKSDLYVFAKCVIYYASAIIGSDDEVHQISCVLILH